MSSNTSSSTFSLTGVLRDLAVSWKLLLDPAVPGLLKIVLPVAALVYWISPLDIIPGMPFDDIAILLLAARLFVSLAPSDSVHRAYGSGKAAGRPGPSHSQQSYGQNGAGPKSQANGQPGDDDGDIIDTTWRIIDD